MPPKASPSSTLRTGRFRAGRRAFGGGHRTPPYYDHAQRRSLPWCGRRQHHPPFRATAELAGLVKGAADRDPQANKLAVEAGTRTGSHRGDLNRDFPKSKTGSTGSVLAKNIWNLMLAVQPDYLFDLHEGYDFHKLNKESVGQSIIYYPVGDGASVAKAMQAAVNRGIANKNQRFSLLKYPVKGSLARPPAWCWAPGHDLETSRKQPLDTRVQQHVTMVRAALEKLGML